MASCRRTDARLQSWIWNFLVVWLDARIDEVNRQDCLDIVVTLREVAYNVETFTDMNESIDFITDLDDDRVVLICSGAFAPRIIPVVQEIAQVDTVFILGDHQTRHDQWVKHWPKLKGVFTDITLLCQALIHIVRKSDQNSMSFGFVPLDKQNLDQLNPSFMYTQLLKEILLTIDFSQEHIEGFTKYCRERFSDDIISQKSIAKIKREYYWHSPIWWYTSPCFLHWMLNKALRDMEIELIISMGFFIADLHRQIVALHFRQCAIETNLKSLTVYRGQGLSKKDFAQLIATKGGLISFNNFLSTSTNRQVSLAFAQQTTKTIDSVGILFVVHIDPLIASTAFARVRNVGYFQGEEEILFSMQSTFRIQDIKQISGSNRLWELELTFTSDDDPQLRLLTNHMREENTGSTGWHRLGDFLITLGQFNQAERLYQTLQKQALTEREEAFLFYQLGWIKKGQAAYTEAIAFYEKSIQINEKILSSTDPALAASHCNLGSVYNHMGEYFKALSCYEKALALFRETLPSDHPDLATTYSNIGLLYANMNEYSEALSYYEKTVQIWQKTLSPNHPDFATLYSNIGSAYDQMGESCKAFEYFEKALAIRQKTLLPNHPSLAISYNSIGSVHDHMSEYSKALPFYEKALEIYENNCPPNHPHLQSTRERIEFVKKKF